MSPAFGFLTIPGIRGGSVAEHHRDAFDTVDFSVGFSRASAPIGGGGTAGRVHAQELSVVVRDAPGIVGLIGASLRGTVLPLVTLDACTGSGATGPVCPLQLVLSDAVVTSVSYSCDGCNAEPMSAQVTFAYERLALAHVAPAAGGGITRYEFAFDFATGSPVAALPSYSAPPGTGPLLVDLGDVNDADATSFSHAVVNPAIVGGGGIGVGTPTQTDVSIALPSGKPTVAFFEHLATGQIANLRVDARVPGCAGVCPTKVLTASSAVLTSLNITTMASSVTVSGSVLTWDFSDGATDRQTLRYDFLEGKVF